MSLMPLTAQLKLNEKIHKAFSQIVHLQVEITI